MTKTTETRKRLTPAERAKQIREMNIGAPLGGRDSKIVRLPKMAEKGWHCAWRNYTPDRMSELEKMGYEPVYQHELGELIPSNSTELVTRTAGSFGDGNGGDMILMKIPKEIYDERQRNKWDSSHEKQLAAINSANSVDASGEVSDAKNSALQIKTSVDVETIA